MAQQEHTKFEVFTKEFKSEDSINQILSDIENWIKEKKVASKSIGVEFLEKANYIVMSLGYRDDEDAYNVKLKSSLIDKIEVGADYTQLEKKMSETASKLSNIICHELFITGTNDFYMVFMVKE